MAVRQAIVIVHGMGEQKPQDQIRRFVDTAFPLVKGERVYVSRPDNVADSYEARRYLAPRQVDDDGEEIYAQTELYELHWAHLMQGNRLDDLWPTFRRVLLQRPTRVPNGLRVLWVILWLLIIGAAVAVWFNRGRFNFETIQWTDVLAVVLGTGIAASALTYGLTRFVPRWLKSSFVDVVRYLDTSPRSYAERASIRRHAVDILKGLTESGRYDRIIVVAHSLGAFIAHDAIAYYWSQVNHLHTGWPEKGVPRPVAPDGLDDLEAAAKAIRGISSPKDISDELMDEFRTAQRKLWQGIRHQGNPWRITDLVTVGTPMYMADQIATIGKPRLKESIAKLEVAICPPAENPRLPGTIGQQTLYTYVNRGRRVLFHAAPFAVTRWTNMWFPARLGFFGDWFGGPLARLYGFGVRDIPLPQKSFGMWIPGAAHSVYFKYGEDRTPGSVAQQIADAMDLASTEWVELETESSPTPDSDTA
ncbi:MAG TPA: hypothetical protein VF148_13620 [Acidimicrobiia bacterium]